MPVNLDDFFDCHRWLEGHPYFFYLPVGKTENQPGFSESLDITIVKVNPDTASIDEDNSLNTQVEVWLECGPYVEDDLGHRQFGIAAHDPELDCGGPTYEEAIKTLARLVKDRHGDYVPYDLCGHCLRRLPTNTGSHGSDGLWFCSDDCSGRGFIDFEFEPAESGLLRLIPAEERCDCEHHGGAA